MTATRVLKDESTSMGMTATDINNAVNNAVSKYMAYSKVPVRQLFGIPRGGMAVAYKFAHEFENRNPSWPDIVVDKARPDMTWHDYPDALIVDDIVDSGATIKPYMDRGFKTMAVVVRASCPENLKPTFWGLTMMTTKYVDFPWDEQSGTPEDAVVRILEYIGLNPNDPSIKETPRRFLSWLNEFRVDQPDPEITVFEGIKYDQMIVVRDIPFTSLCEHHLLPFIGTAAVAYIPGKTGDVIGLSKLARIVMHTAKRPQVQERMTEQVLGTVMGLSLSEHVGVVVKAEHMCMSLRGPRALGSSTVTSALSGDFKDDPKTREEFLKLSGFS